MTQRYLDVSKTASRFLVLSGLLLGIVCSNVADNERIELVPIMLKCVNGVQHPSILPVGFSIKGDQIVLANGNALTPVCDCKDGYDGDLCDQLTEAENPEIPSTQAPRLTTSIDRETRPTFPTAKCVFGFVGDAPCKITEVEAVVLLVLIAIAFALLFTFIWLPIVKRQRRKLERILLLESVSSEEKEETKDKDFLLETSLRKLIDEVKFDQRFLIDYSKLRLSHSVLGDGCFGIVHSAEYVDNDTKTNVACKTLRSIFDLGALKDLLCEAQLMTTLRHPHVLGLVGVAFNKRCKPVIVTELMPGGSLDKLLDEAILTEEERLRYGKEIASGMFYLHSCHIIHRDLAARNCMLTESNSVRICDFGLSRELHDYTPTYPFRHDRLLPRDWLAPEAVYDKIAAPASDVWSYGITLWEIFAQARPNYPIYCTMDEFFDAVKNGTRLKKPASCPEEFFTEVIEKCWQYDPQRRPSFGHLYMDMDKRFNEHRVLAEAQSCSKLKEIRQENTKSCSRGSSTDESDAGYVSLTSCGRDSL